MNRKNARKVLAFMLILAMVFGLSACAGNQSTGNQGSNIQSTDNQGMNDQKIDAAPETVVTTPNENEPEGNTANSEVCGLWSAGGELIHIANDYCLYYRFGSSSGNNPVACIGYIYDGSYTYDGNLLSMSIYDMEGNLYLSAEFTLENGMLCRDGDPVARKLSDNTGEYGRVTGNWHLLGDDFNIGSSVGGYAFNGTQMTFYNDGTCHSNWDDGSGIDSGSYVLTSKFDCPAITLVDQYGFEAGTYQYEFLTNDLLMIYTTDDGYGYPFYRQN